METSDLAEHTNVAAALLSAMANPTSLLIITRLVKADAPDRTLATHVGLTQSALSQHLSKLRAQKLVKTRRDAQTIYYSSNSEPVMKILATLEDIYVTENRSRSAA